MCFLLVFPFNAETALEQDRKPWFKLWFKVNELYNTRRVYQSHFPAVLHLFLVAESFVGKGRYIKKIRMRWRGRFGIQVKKFCHYFLVLKEGTGKEKNIKRRLKHMNELDGDSETSKTHCELFSLVVKCIVQNFSSSYLALCVSAVVVRAEQSSKVIRIF